LHVEIGGVSRFGFLRFWFISGFGSTGVLGFGFLLMFGLVEVEGVFDEGLGFSAEANDG
jgi:hypothetical protein